MFPKLEPLRLNVDQPGFVVQEIPRLWSLVSAVLFHPQSTDRYWRFWKWLQWKINHMAFIWMNTEATGGCRRISFGFNSTKTCLFTQYACWAIDHLCTLLDQTMLFDFSFSCTLGFVFKGLSCLQRMQKHLEPRNQCDHNGKRLSITQWHQTYFSILQLTSDSSPDQHLKDVRILIEMIRSDLEGATAQTDSERPQDHLTPLFSILQTCQLPCFRNFDRICSHVCLTLDLSADSFKNDRTAT